MQVVGPRRAAERLPPARERSEPALSAVPHVEFCRRAFRRKCSGVVVLRRVVLRSGEAEW